jgi:HEAT repeat protein
MRHNIMLNAILLLSLAVPSAALLTAADLQKETSEDALIAVLESQGVPEDKALACKRLAIYGTSRAVPVLATLLPNPELSSWARIALEAIPDEAAGRALQEATTQVQGKQLVGVVNSLAVRKEAAAVNDLIRLMAGEDEQVVVAAAIALGKIGDPRGVQALRLAIADVRPEVRSAAGEGCIYAAEKMYEAGKRADAAKLYEIVRQADVPRSRRQEATRGMILAMPESRVELLGELLRSEDKHLLRLGLTLVREVPGENLTVALGGMLAQVGIDRKPMLLRAIADRRDAAVQPIVLEAAESGEKEIQLIALEALATIGDEASIPKLLALAVTGDTDMSESATRALAGLPGSNTSNAIAQRLEASLGQERLILLRLAGQRRIESSLAAVVAATKEPSSEVRKTAFMALGELAKMDHVPIFLSALGEASNENSGQTSAILAGLRAACVRMKERDACAQLLGAAILKMETDARCSLLEILGAMEGPAALKIVADAAKQGDPRVQDVASRELGEWMTPDAARALLDLAQDPKASKFQVRAMRGMIRILRQFVMESNEREDLCRRAFAAANRNEEKQLVLEVLERYPSLEMLKIAVDAAKQPVNERKAMATSTAIAIAASLGLNEDVRSVLSELGGKTAKVEILRASYGADDQQKDVTEILRKYAADFPLILLPEDFNTVFGGDPAPNVRKQLVVEYKLDNAPGTARFEENAPVWLPPVEK